MPAQEAPNRDEARRTFLRAVASTAGAVLVGCVGTSSEEAEVTPGEDLMQEHGVLERILLIYEEAALRIDRGESLDVTALAGAAGIVRRFVQDYHEKLEEDVVFPRLESARRETRLVGILRRQHQRGREVTDAIVKLAAAAAPSTELARALRKFTHMYRPHAAREDTVLFPAFRSLLGRSAYEELGETFERREHARFGERGFEHVVAEVSSLEATFAISDLAGFTP